MHCRLLIAGRETLLGAALVDAAGAAGYDLVAPDAHAVDWTRIEEVDDLIDRARPDAVIVAAGRSGGIGLNNARPADLMRDNLLTATHLIEAAHLYRVKKLVYLASSCSYPRLAPQPLRVESLLDGPLEPTSGPYALAKLAGWQLCDAYRRQHGDCFVTAIPANAFGPHDDFSAEGGHVIPALLARMHAAKRAGERCLQVWGTGTPRREFLYAADVADACLFVLRHYEGEAPINLAGGPEVTIADLARQIAAVVGYTGAIQFDASRPDGAPRKGLDATPLLALGWRPRTPFRAALDQTYRWYLDQLASTTTLQPAPSEDTRHVHTAVSGALSYSPSGGGGRPRLSDGPHQESRSPVHRSGGGVGRRL